MKVSVVLATYNRNELLEQTLQGLASMDTTGLEWELVLADNAGNNETARIAKSFSTSLPLEFLVEKALGKNNALNSALAHASGDFIVFTDDDVIPDQAWVNKLIDAADRWKAADLFGGRILPKYPDGIAVPMITDSDFMRSAYVIADWGLEEGEYHAEKIWGPNMMVRRRVFDQGLRFNPDIGPTGNNYVMGSELEFLLRASEAGHTAVYVPSAIVYHIIRPEQLTNSWICGRAFRLGRGNAYHNKSTSAPKVRKWMLREITTLFAYYVYYSIFGTEAEKLEHAIKFHSMRGHLYQSYKDPR